MSPSVVIAVYTMTWAKSEPSFSSIWTWGFVPFRCVAAGIDKTYSSAIKVQLVDASNVITKFSGEDEISTYVEPVQR